jgi:hypothetical protein
MIPYAGNKLALADHCINWESAKKIKRVDDMLLRKHLVGRSARVGLMLTVS